MPRMHAHWPQVILLPFDPNAKAPFSFYIVYHKFSQRLLNKGNLTITQTIRIHAGNGTNVITQSTSSNGYLDESSMKPQNINCHRAKE